MLYYPWFDEQAHLLGQYATYEEHYRHVKTIVQTNENKYTKADIDDIQVDVDGPPEHLWNSIAPSTEESRMQSMAEGSEQLTEVSQQDLRDNESILTSRPNLHVRFESAANQLEIPPDQYREYMRGLNEQQRSIVMFHRDWCKKAVLALKQSKPVEPYRVFLSGPGGVGKSHVIKLVNGARGEVVHVVTNNNNVTSVLVKFDNNRVGLKSIQTSPQRARFPNAVPLNKYEVVFFAKGKRGSEIKRLQFALTLAWATTIHKVQGLTLDEIVVDMRGGRFSPGQAYVAFSRVKTLDGLHILNFNSKAIKKNIDVKSEMFRLNSNILQPVSQVTCDPSSQVTTALLNVRSILAKLPDITADHSLKSTSILCFCETWLNASQPSPVLLHDQIDIRCDRLTCEKKGGVLMCVPRYFNPSNVQRFANNGIEAVSVTIQIPNAGSVQVAVVYRSPNVTQAMLITVLTRLLTHVSLYNSPCLILGDFNENILHQQNTAIVRLMADFSFTQLVQLPTTAQGTLIDHVYYRNPFIDPASSAIIQVQDTYYSDHDTVYCSIPHRALMNAH